MTFQTILEELDKIYEELPSKETEVKTEPEEVAEACDKKLTEADEEILIDDEPIVDDDSEEADEDVIEIEDDEADEDAEQVRLILECNKCGAIVIKPEAEVVIDEETDLANVEEACQYCEEVEGYKIVGTVAPYVPAVAPIEEGIFNRKKNKKANASANSNTAEEREVTIEIYNENGTKQFSHVFTELPGKMSAEEQFNQMIKSNGLLNRYKASNNKYDWSYVRKSNPASSFDTDKYFNAASKIIKEALSTKEGELEELLNTKINVDATNFGGTGNNVSVLSGGLPEELEAKKAEDEKDLDELLNTKINIDATRAGGEGNDVKVL